MAVTSWVTPVASIGPGGTTCVKSVASTSNHLNNGTNSWGNSNDGGPVVLSESSTATPVSRSVPVPEPGEPLERIVNGQPGGYSGHRLLWLGPHRRRLRRRRLVGRGRVEDIERKPPTRGTATYPSARRGVSLYCTGIRSDKPRTEAQLTGIRFDEVGADTWTTRSTADLADEILDELEAIDAKIIYIGDAPRRPKDSLRADQGDGQMHGAGHAILSGVALGGYLL